MVFAKLFASTYCVRCLFLEHVHIPTNVAADLDPPRIPEASPFSFSSPSLSSSLSLFFSSFFLPLFLLPLVSFHLSQAAQIQFYIIHTVTFILNILQGSVDVCNCGQTSAPVHRTHTCGNPRTNPPLPNLTLTLFPPSPFCLIETLKGFFFLFCI